MGARMKTTCLSCKKLYGETCSALILICLLLTSCTSDQAARYYLDERFPAKSPEDVEVLRDAPSRKYVVIADFQARGANVDYMRREAAKIGADAVIVGMFGGLRDKDEQWASEDRHANSYSRITGTAIKYEE